MTPGTTYTISQKTSHDTATKLFTSTDNNIHSLGTYFVDNLPVRRGLSVDGPVQRSENPPTDCIQNQSLFLHVQGFPDPGSILSLMQYDHP